MFLDNFIEKVSSGWPLTTLAHFKRRKRARATYVYREPNSGQVSACGKIASAVNAGWFRIDLQNLLAFLAKMVTDVSVRIAC